jgi:hypothetical protein
MHYLPPADRAYDVVKPVVVYRLIGRRPSQVYVDDAMTPVSSGHSKNRLSDLVYWRTTARPGDQIQERPGTTLLVTAGGQSFPVLLTEPQPLEPGSAFTHAQSAAAADREVAATLMAEGVVKEAMPRRVKNQVSRGLERMFDERHPLVVDEAPQDLDEVAAEPRRQGAFGRNRRGRVG